MTAICPSTSMNSLSCASCSKQHCLTLSFMITQKTQWLHPALLPVISSCTYSGWASPMSWGEHIVPSWIQGYFQQHRLAFECFCSLLLDCPSYVKLSSSVHSGTLSHCDQCGIYSKALNELRVTLVLPRYTRDPTHGSWVF